MKPLDAEIILGDNSKINADGIGTINMHVKGVAAKDAEKKGKETNLELTLKQVVYSKAMPNNPPHDIILSIGNMTDKGWTAIFQSPDQSIPKAKETIMDGSYLLHKESKTIIPLYRTKEGWYLHGTVPQNYGKIRITQSNLRIESKISLKKLKLVPIDLAKLRKIYEMHEKFGHASGRALVQLMRTQGYDVTPQEVHEATGCCEICNKSQDTEDTA